ncbi:hypothetical protein FI667_g6161, partial [Globisporangium splendens]
MSRHQTLLDIYGNPASSSSKDNVNTSRNGERNERKRMPLLENRRLKQIRRPTSASVTATATTLMGNSNAYLKRAMVCATTQTMSGRPARPPCPPRHGAETTNVISSCTGDPSTLAIETNSRQALEAQLVHTPPTSPQSTTQDAVPSVDKKRVPFRSPGARTVSQTTNSSNNRSANVPEGKMVLSLYGDGFVEIPPSGNQDSMLHDGFSIQIRLFKAADIETAAKQSLIDSACVTAVRRSVSTIPRGAVGGQTTWAAASLSSSTSIYIGGHPSYSRSVRDWRMRIGFIGLIASVQLWKTGDVAGVIWGDVLVNEDNGESITACTGTFEITMLLSRATGRHAVELQVHSMASTSFFPNPEEIKKKISSIILHEAKRSPGEEVHDQGFRYYLALAGCSRQNRERSFLEAVMNREIVLTERKVISVLQKIGFYLANSELLEVVRYFKYIQDEHMRKRNRTEDLPSLSMPPPSAEGMYALPLLDTLSICATLDCEGDLVKSPWRFIGIPLGHDFQLHEFIHEDCPTTQDQKISLHQTRVGYNENAHPDTESDDGSSCRNKNDCCVRLQIENDRSCRWFALAALSRSKKLHHWKIQALGGCSQANSIHACLDGMHELLVEHAIVQIYEIVVSFESGTEEESGYEDYAKRFSKNIQFGRNGRVRLIPIVASATSEEKCTSRRNSFGTSSPLITSLKLQGSENAIEVYRHGSSYRTLPTIQSIYRSILRMLAEHGIKESLQYNPFAAQENKVKRQVEIRVVNEQTNSPVEKAHVFIEKNLDNIKHSTSFVKKIMPTLTMGSRLVSIRRRLQMKRVLDDTRAFAVTFAEEVISIGTKVAHYTSRFHIHLGWNAFKPNSRHLIVLSPRIHQKDSYRAVFSYVNAVRSMEAIVEVFKDKVGAVCRVFGMCST